MLYLSAVAAEVGALEATPTGSKADWELLLGPDWQVGVDGLIESAADGGLLVTAREASVLNRVIQLGRATALRPLWPYLESPDASVVTMIARWTAGDAEVDRWKALVQAEAGHLTPQNIARVVELAASSTDRLRLRAALALHGRTPHSENRNRRWSVTQVGVEAIEAVARRADQVEYPPSVRSSLGWISHDIHHNNVAALNHWLSEADANSDAPANWILAHIESIDDGLVPRLLEFLPKASPELKQTLLLGLARLASAGNVPGEHQEGVRAAVAAIPQAIRQKVRVVPDGPVTYLEIAARAAAESDEGSRLDDARWMVEESMLWLDDECLSDRAECVKRLTQIGRGLHVTLGPNGYWAKANESAASLAENEEALRLLLSWVESLNLAERPDDRSDDILTALEALARVSPNAFAALADPDIWESILTEWAETAWHWTTRLASVQLLGLLRRVTERIAATLRAAMNDVSFVQLAAYESVGEFRRMKGDIVPELLDLLDDPSANVVASTTRLLVSLARSEGAIVDRRRILRSLQDVVSGSPKVGSVYLMQEDDGTMSIQFVDRLDRILYRAIFEVSGL